jgi:HEAT repeat protein
MKTFLMPLFLIACAIAANGGRTANSVGGVTNEALPELIDRAEPTINRSPTESRMEEVWNANHTNVRKISGRDSPANRQELQLRLADNRRPLATRLLYAGILAGWGDKHGQEFLLRQCRTANSLEGIRDAFWLMGHLDRLQDRRAEDNQRKEIDMRWAELFMLEALQDTREFTSAPWSETVQSMALDDFCGNFAGQLAAMKSPKLFPILAKLFNDGKSSTRIISSAFAELGDQRAVPLLLKALPTSTDDDVFGQIAFALAKLHSKEAIPILLKHLDNYQTYDALSQYSDPRILPALTNALPNLHDDYARDAARTLVIQLEGGDKLPKLIALAEDPNCKCMESPLLLIAALKDKRAVPFATKVLNTSPELVQRAFAVQILAAIPDSPEAIKALIDALDINFNAVATGKNVMEDQNKRVRMEISEDLQKLTGQNFGTDKKRWMEWFTRTHA